MTLDTTVVAVKTLDLKRKNNHSFLYCKAKDVHFPLSDTELLYWEVLSEHPHLIDAYTLLKTKVTVSSYALEVDLLTFVKRLLSKDLVCLSF